MIARRIDVGRCAQDVGPGATVSSYAGEVGGSTLFFVSPHPGNAFAQAIDAVLECLARSVNLALSW